jgi:hypothetical protein
MAYFTEQQLESSAYSHEVRNRALKTLNASMARASLSIFLSHSYKDRTLAKGIVYRLAELGIEVYVDWNDSDMPRITNRQTAEKIKSEIQDNNLFMALITRNAMESKWVPWEIGVADRAKGEEKVLIIPVEERSGNFAGSEYLQLYRRVEIANGGAIGLFEPSQGKGDYLVEHFKKFTHRPVILG